MENPLSKPRLLILVAEDDEDDRKLLRIAADRVSLSGYLRFLRDGAELTDYLKQCMLTVDANPLPQPDLILLDLNMPRKNGREVLEDMAKGALAPVPVVIWTTSADRNDREECLRLGARDFFTKPTTMEGFVSKLKQIMAMKGLSAHATTETSGGKIPDTP